MISRHESINTYMNQGILEANINFAKMHQTPFCVAKFGFEVDLENGFFFKDFITFITTELEFQSVLQEANDTFILILRDTKIHQAKKLLKHLEQSIKQYFKIELKNIGMTLFDLSVAHSDTKITYFL